MLPKGGGESLRKLQGAGGDVRQGGIEEGCRTGQSHLYGSEQELRNVIWLWLMETNCVWVGDGEG